MNLTSIMEYIVDAFLRAIELMQDTFIFSVGGDDGVSVSLFNLLVAGLVLDLILYVIFPWFGGDDDD